MKQRNVTHSHGKEGESQAALFLKKQKFKILHQNYKTSRYEIDIIAKRKRRLYFVEVKYRSSGDYGQGYDYVTDRKLKQMAYAAEKWVAEHGYTGEYQLAVISIVADEITFFQDLWQ